MMNRIVHNVRKVCRFKGLSRFDEMKHGEMTKSPR